MREIKFRAWEKNLREMIPVDDIQFRRNDIIQQDGIKLHPREVQPTIINTKGAWRLLDEVELMQYTGITTVNGNDLYEGDIIENDSEWWQIVFSEGKFICDPIKGGNVWMDIAELASSSETWLQGNIYANPELLTE